MATSKIEITTTLVAEIGTYTSDWKKRIATIQVWYMKSSDKYYVVASRKVSNEFESLLLSAARDGALLNNLEINTRWECRYVST